MAIRTTSEAVGKLHPAGSDEDEDVDFTPFIETANNLVDQVCLESDYSDATLELIERWLAAHFYAQLDPRTVMEEVRGARERFEGETKIRLDNTRYGQQAMIIDTAGNLKALNEGKGKITAKALYVGEDPDAIRYSL